MVRRNTDEFRVLTTGPAVLLDSLASAANSDEFFGVFCT